MTPSMRQRAEAMTAVLEEENAALLALDLPRAIALLPRKHAAADALASAQASVAPTSAARAELGRTAERLDTLAAENRRLLERAINVQRDVMVLLARAAPRRAPAPRYTAAGAIAVAVAGPMALSSRA